MSEISRSNTRGRLACFTNAWRVAIQLSEATGAHVIIERTGDPMRPFIVRPRAENDNDPVAHIQTLL